MRPDEPQGVVPRAGMPAAVVAGILVVIAVAAAMRFPLLAAERLWFDEVFSVVVSSQSVAELWRRALADQTNPPGFYLLLGAWIRLGSYDEAWLRTLGAIVGTLTPAAVISCARALGAAWRPALVAGTLTAVSPLLVMKSAEVRAYAPLAFVATVAMAQVARIALADRAPRTREFIALAALQIALVMLHYFGALTVVALTLAGLSASRPRGGDPGAGRRATGIVAASAPALLILAAWLALVVRSADAGFASNAAWITAPGISTLPSFATEMVGVFGMRTLAWVVLVALAGSTAWAATAGRSRRTEILLLAVVLPLALAFGTGWLTGRPLWVSRYLISTVPPLMMLLALAAESLPSRMRFPAATLLLLWAGVAGVHATVSRTLKTDWVRVLGELSGGRATLICTNESFVSLPLEYYAVRDQLPVRVVEMPRCRATGERAWAVYRPGTESSFAELTDRGVTFGPRLSLVTSLPPTAARRIVWPR